MMIVTFDFAFGVAFLLFPAICRCRREGSDFLKDGVIGIRAIFLFFGPIALPGGVSGMADGEGVVVLLGSLRGFFSRKDVSSNPKNLCQSTFI